MASAQEAAPKVEIFGGYSFLRVGLGNGLDSVTGHGFNLSVAGNITKNFGIVGEFSRYSKSDQLGDIFNDPDLNLINVDASVQWYYVARGRIGLWMIEKSENLRYLPNLFITYPL
jgi:hypothetical protein